MNAEREPEQRPSRGTVVMMPPRGPQPPADSRQTASAGQDHAEPADEPGYGHGV